MAARPMPSSKEPLPSHKKIQKVRDQLGYILEKMKKNTLFTPKTTELEDLAKDIIDIIGKYHDQVVKEQSFLKNAIIDLTEIPTMHPTMQRIAISTAIETATKNLDHFLAKV